MGVKVGLKVGTKAGPDDPFVPLLLLLLLRLARIGREDGDVDGAAVGVRVGK